MRRKRDAIFLDWCCSEESADARGGPRSESLSLSAPEREIRLCSLAYNKARSHKDFKKIALPLPFLTCLLILPSHSTCCVEDDMGREFLLALANMTGEWVASVDSMVSSRSIPPVRANLSLHTRKLPLLSLPPVHVYRDKLLKCLEHNQISPAARGRIADNFALHASVCRNCVMNEVETLLGSADVINTRFDASQLIEAVKEKFIAELNNTIEVHISRIEELTKPHTIETTREQSADSFNDTTCDQPSARGHPPEAVALLERAYQYTANISQSEKMRLADLTGLQPRQVIIW